jgi:hypothetical protein
MAANHFPRALVDYSNAWAATGDTFDSESSSPSEGKEQTLRYRTAATFPPVPNMRGKNNYWASFLCDLQGFRHHDGINQGGTKRPASLAQL